MSSDSLYSLTCVASGFALGSFVRGSWILGSVVWIAGGFVGMYGLLKETEEQHTTPTPTTGRDGKDGEG